MQRRAVVVRVLIGLATAGLVTLHVVLAAQRGFSAEADVLVRQLLVRAWLPAITIVAGALIGLLRPLERNAVVASLMLLGFSLVLFDASGLGPAALRWLVPLSGAMSLAVPALTLDFALRFPEPAPLDVRRPWLRAAAYAGSALLWMGIAATLSSGELAPVRAWAAFLWCSLLYGLSISVLLDAGARELKPDDRRRLRIIATGTGLGLGALGLVAGAQRLGLGAPGLTAVAALVMSAFPLGFVYAVVRHRVFGVDVIVRRGLQYLLLSRGFVAVQAVAWTYFSVQAWQAFVQGRPWTVLFYVLVASMFHDAVKGLARKLMPVLDRRFFRESYDARRILLDVGEDARRLASRPAALLDAFCDRIRDALHPSSVQVLPAGATAGGLLLPVATPEHAHAVIALGDKLSEEPWSREDRELLEGAAHQVAIALDNARLFARVAEQQRLEREMEIAREVQQQLFPRELPPLPGLACAGECRPALGVGGDYWDVLPLGGGRVAIVLGDVAGKGIPAALLMARLQGVLRTHAVLHPDDPAAVIATVNRAMHESSDGARYATLFYGVFDAGRSRLDFVNAGHNPPFLVRASGTETLCAGGLVVGLLPETAYEPGTVAFAPGDLLLLYSDGITEAESPSGDMYGEERLLELARARQGDGPEAVRTAVLESVERFADGAPLRDDRTVLVAVALDRLAAMAPAG